jgi:hypothetical protein
LKPQTFARVNENERELESMIRIPSGVKFTESGFEATHGYSIYARAKWEAWNTTVSVDVNYADVEASGAGLKGNVSKGVYVEVKPFPVVAVAIGMAVIALTPWPDELSLPAILKLLGDAVRNPALGVP